MFVKKIKHITLALFLLISSIGMAVSIKYCHDQIADISIFKSPEPCCSNPNCCNDRTFNFQLESNYVIEKTFEQEKKNDNLIILNIPFKIFSTLDNQECNNEFELDLSIPLIIVDIPIQFQCFLI